MSIYLFTPAPVAPSGANVKVFTDAGCTTLATITSVEGLPIPGSVIPSDGQTGALPHFLGPQTSLWLKVQVTGGATVALTATDSGPAANPGGAFAPLDSPAFTGTPTVNGSPLGGGGAAGGPVLKAFPFDASTAGLATGYNTGYTPDVGDILLNAWIDVITAWDGTTPNADAGFFVDPSPDNGLFGWGGTVIDLAAAAEEANWMPGGVAAGGSTNSDLASRSPATNPQSPVRFIASHPVKILVNQTGVMGGADAGATVGSAVLYLLVATPPFS